MALQFGNTWWGKKWLQSLDKIDFQNRLPRGKIYARKGAVQEISFRKDCCKAKVKGTRPRPYSVELKFPQLSENQKERLIEGLLTEPATISQLLNRELSSSLLNIAIYNGIQIFPRSWMDWDMRCSCPDWAIPCKHLASVVYVISREIDNDPFLIFRLLGLDILAELRKKNLGIEEHNPSIISTERFFRLGKKTEFEEGSQDFKASFSDIRLQHSALLLLLPKQPAFYHYGDFHSEYAKAWRKIQKAAKKTIGHPKYLSKYFRSTLSQESISKYSKITIQLGHNGAWQIFHDGNDIPTNRFIQEILSLEPEGISNYHQSVYFSYHLLNTLIHFLAEGLLLPQLTQNKNKSYSIYWKAIVFDNNIRTIMENLHQILPKEFILLQKGTELPRPEQVLLAIFAQKMVAQFSELSTTNSFLSLFFEAEDYGFTGLGETQLPSAINIWLERYELEITEHQIFLIVSEGESDFSIGFEVETEGKRIALSELLQQKEYVSKQFGFIRKLMLLSGFIPGLDLHLNQRAEIPISLSSSAFAPFLMEILPAVQLFGIQVVLPKVLKEILRPKPTVEISKIVGLSVTSLRLDDLLKFNWRVAIGDQIISVEECKQLFHTTEKLIKFRGRYIYVDESDLQKIITHISKAKDLSKHELLQIVLSEEYQEAEVFITPEIQEILRELREQTNVGLPKMLQAKLRPYQERGFSWMVRNYKLGFGSILADDMGLGKTLQAITLLLYFKEMSMLSAEKQALIIMPTSLLTNWQREVEKFAPSLSTSTYHGTDRTFESTDLIFTSYGTLRSDISAFKKIEWQAVIIDEAQHIKTPSAQQTKAVKSLKTKCRIALSGTPVENRLSEFWSIMDFTNKGFLGTHTSFAKQFSKPIQVDRDSRVASRFQNITKPFLMRRLKTDKTIISDLPDKIEQNTYCVLTESQAVLYQKTVDEALKAIVAEKQELFTRQGLILQMILALKQICNHPTQFLKNKKKEASLSGKTKAVLDLLSTILERDEKVLIFTQFREMGDLLQEFIVQELDEEVMFFHGGSSRKQREQMVDDFQSQRNKRVFILSIKAAGTGLNLTAASHVIHYDLWWNPAVEQQATDRAYRIGQKKNVHVHRFICRNTFEERIDAMIQEKKALADMTISTGETWIGNLSDRELRKVFERS